MHPAELRSIVQAINDLKQEVRLSNLIALRLDPQWGYDDFYWDDVDEQITKQIGLEKFA